MTTSQSTLNVWPALLKVQKALKPTKRTASAPDKDYLYTPIDQVVVAAQKLLHRQGLMWSQAECGASGRVIVETTVIHVGTGEWVANVCGISVHGNREDQLAAISLMRRYGLCLLLGVVQESESDAAMRAANGRFLDGLSAAQREVKARQEAVR